MLAGGPSPTRGERPPDYLFETLAGSTGLTGSLDGKGSEARFNQPRGLAIDSAGNVFVADTDNHTVRKINVSGRVTTLAGVAGQAGIFDGKGPEARFDYPSALAVDAAGNIFVADSCSIRKITADGDVTRLAGSSTSRNDYVDGTDYGASFNEIGGMAVDRAGNLYVSERHYRTIRKITPDGVVTTLAGDRDSWGVPPGGKPSADGKGTAARFQRPTGLAVDDAGNIYVADSGDSTIRKVTPDGVVTTIAGAPYEDGYVDGNRSQARFKSPTAVAADGAGNLYILDAFIRKLTPGGEVTTLAGFSTDGTDNATPFRAGGIAVDPAGNLLLADTGNQAVRRGHVVAVSPLTTEPQSQSAPEGANVTLTPAMPVDAAAKLRWLHNGRALPEAIGPTLTVENVQPVSTGCYVAVATKEGVSAMVGAAIVGVTTKAKVMGGAREIGADIRHPNGNACDQVLMTGAAAAITADEGQVTRIAFVDLTNDIVQVEFSGPGTLSLVLDAASGPALAVNYNQPCVTYMKGHAGIVITGADERTNVAIFTVGRLTAFDPTGTFDLLRPWANGNGPASNASPLFVGHPVADYDGVADIGFIAIASANGKFGGVRTANAHYFAAKGLTGLYAPGIAFQGPIFIGDITAFDAAIPVFMIGSAETTWITGGDLLQANGQPLQITGLSALRLTDGYDSHSRHLGAKMCLASILNQGQVVLIFNSW